MIQQYALEKNQIEHDLNDFNVPKISVDPEQESQYDNLPVATWYEGSMQSPDSPSI
jgi:hypothetical protein